ncbi:MAG: hypothetical protein JWR61_3736 [Ferruginibacter sp.]|nr:hypothetical protein [Ferruginibacter sp.]
MKYGVLLFTYFQVGWSLTEKPLTPDWAEVNT